MRMPKEILILLINFTTWPYLGFALQDFQTYFSAQIRTSGQCLCLCQQGSCPDSFPHFSISHLRRQRPIAELHVLSQRVETMVRETVRDPQPFFSPPFSRLQLTLQQCLVYNLIADLKASAKIAISLGRCRKSQFAATFHAAARRSKKSVFATPLMRLL